MRARFQLLLSTAVLTACVVVASAQTHIETAIRPAISPVTLSAEDAPAAGRPPGSDPGKVSPLERPATRLRGFSVQASEVGTRLRLHTDGALRNVGTFVLENPGRLVIDLYDLRATDTPASLPLGNQYISQIRVGRHQDKLRVVIDAGAAPSPFERIETEVRPDGLVVVVGFPEDSDDGDRIARGPADSAVEIEASAAELGIPADASGRTEDKAGRPPALVALDRAFVLPTSLPTGGTRGSAPRSAVPTSARPEEVEPPASTRNVHLELQAERTRLDPSIPRAIRASRSWKDTLDFDSGAVSSKRPEVAWGDASFDPGRAVAGDGLGVATLHDWEQNTVTANRIKLGLLEDRVRLTTRYGRSRYDPADSYRASSAGAEAVRDWDLSLGRRAAIGQAFSQRLDASLWNSPLARIGAFGSYRRVDPLFEWKETGKTDPFAKSDRRAFETGGTIGAGMLGLTLSRISEQADIDDFRVDHRPSRRSYRAVLAASLDPLRQLSDGAPDLGLSRFVPDSAWLSVTQGRVDPGDSPGSAATRDLGFGTSWDGETSSATLSFWRSSYENGGIDLEWSGSGADLAYGIYRERWDLYAGLGAQRYRNDEADDTSFESSFAGYLSLALRPERVPDLVTTLNLNRYEAEYSAFGDVRSDGWGLQTVLDFSKYLPPTREGCRPHLKAYYRVGWSKSWNEFADPDFDHALMASFEVDC